MTEENVTGNLNALCRRLKLNYLDQQLETVLEAAKAGRYSAAETLEFALSIEVSNREARRIDIGMKVAHFESVKRLEDYDFSLMPALDESIIRDLARLEWVSTGANVLFLGPPGVGKTHLAIALGREAVKAGYSVSFVLASDLMDELEKSSRDNDLKRVMLKYTKPRVLIIDEIGYLPIRAQTAHLFFQLVSVRYKKHLSIVMTGNRPVSEWGLVFGDPTATSAILDRTLHHCEIVAIRGESVRMLEKRRAGLIKAKDSAATAEVISAAKTEARNLAEVDPEL